MELIFIACLPQVFKAFDKETGQGLAVKRSWKKGRTADEIQLLQQELSINKHLQAFPHDNIIHTIDNCQDRKYVYAVCELAEGGKAT